MLSRTLTLNPCPLHINPLPCLKLLENKAAPFLSSSLFSLSTLVLLSTILVMLSPVTLGLGGTTQNLNWIQSSAWGREKGRAGQYLFNLNSLIGWKSSIHLRFDGGSIQLWRSPDIWIWICAMCIIIPPYHRGYYKAILVESFMKIFSSMKKTVQKYFLQHNLKRKSSSKINSKQNNYMKTYHFKTTVWAPWSMKSNSIEHLANKKC